MEKLKNNARLYPGFFWYGAPSAEPSSISPTASPMSRNPLSQNMGSKLGKREVSVLVALFPSQGLLGGGPLGQRLLTSDLVLGSLGQVWI